MEQKDLFEGPPVIEQPWSRREVIGWMLEALGNPNGKTDAAALRQGVGHSLSMLEVFWPTCSRLETRVCGTFDWEAEQIALTWRKRRLRRSPIAPTAWYDCFVQIGGCCDAKDLPSAIAIGSALHSHLTGAGVNRRILGLVQSELGIDSGQSCHGRFRPRHWTHSAQLRTLWTLVGQLQMACTRHAERARELRLRGLDWPYYF